MTGRQLSLRNFLLILAAITVGTIVLLLGAGFVYALIAPAEGKAPLIRLPDPAVSVKLPRDLAAHQDYLTEWWTIYANVIDDADHAYGITMHICKRFPLLRKLDSMVWHTALPQPEFIGYYALANIVERKMITDERNGMADNDYRANEETLEINLTDWRILQTATGLSLRMQGNNALIHLNLVGDNPPVRQGQEGYAWRGEDLPPAYVLSWPRLTVEGSLIFNAAVHPVTGQAWLEREYTSYLPSSRMSSWDRLVLMLDNHHDLILWDARCGGERRCASIPATLISPDGLATQIPADQVQVNPSESWTSQETGVKYNIEWQIKLEAYDAAMIVTAQLPDGELSYAQGGVHVWASPVHVAGRWGAQAVQGEGYGEISGLVEPLERRY
ncbi:MAG TPA: lipocalin family protein [bacterium]|nr:lipocalin family protein [bacterium]